MSIANTRFQQELNCKPCSANQDATKDCRRCYFSQVPAFNDAFFLQAVQPYSWFAAFLLFLSYVIGLWFTLRTHAAVIWTTDGEEKKTPANFPSQPNDSTILPPVGKQVPRQAGPANPKGSIRESQMYARILGQSLKQIGLSQTESDILEQQASTAGDNSSHSPYVVPPKSRESSTPNLGLPGLSDEQNERFVRQVTEVAATAATVAARDATRSTKKPSVHSNPPASQSVKASGVPGLIHTEEADESAIYVETHASSGGHDAPNWSKTKSSVILLGATLLYAIIAEILVNTVDVVLESVDVDEKFLGITLFALVPNTTEFLVSWFLISIIAHCLSLAVQCHDLIHDFCCLERYIIRRKRKYSFINGNWLGLCFASLFAPNPGSSPIQRHP